MSVEYYGEGDNQYQVETSGGTKLGHMAGQGSGKYGERLPTQSTAEAAGNIQWRDIQQFFDAEGNLSDREGLQGYILTYFPDVIRDMRGVSGSEYVKHRDMAKKYAAYKAGDKDDPDTENVKEGLTSAEWKMVEFSLDKMGNKSPYKVGYNEMRGINDRINRKIIELVQHMPKMRIDKGSLASAKGLRAASIADISGKIASKRKGEMEAMGMGGIGGGTSDPYSLGSFNPYTELYGEAMEDASGYGGVYGLGTEKEEEFAGVFEQYMTGI